MLKSMIAEEGEVLGIGDENFNVEKELIQEEHHLVKKFQLGVVNDKQS